MSSKKKKRRAPKSGYRAPAPVVAPEPARRRSELPPFLGFLSARGGDSPFPPVRTSLARGFATVGSSPVLLAASFVVVLLAWLGLTALGFEGSPNRLGIALAIPPVSTVYFDASGGVNIYGFGPAGLVAAIGFLFVRAVVLAVASGIIVEALEGGGSSLEGARRGVRAFPIVLAANVLGLSMALAGSFILPLLGPGLGFLGSVATLVAALYFFVFVPAAAIREGRGLQETLRRSARAALMPGNRHLLMTVLYLLLAIVIVVAVAPGGNAITANPSFPAWTYALIATFVHLGFLAAFCYRWIVAEPEVPEQPLRRRR